MFLQGEVKLIWRKSILQQQATYVFVIIMYEQIKRVLGPCVGSFTEGKSKFSFPSLLVLCRVSKIRLYLCICNQMNLQFYHAGAYFAIFRFSLGLFFAYWLFRRSNKINDHYKTRIRLVINFKMVILKLALMAVITR